MAAAMMEEPDNKGPRVPWDESGLIQNVMSNLTLLDGHGDPPRGFSIVLATEEERKAVVELRKWANDFKRTHEGSIFLTREIEDLFYNLPSHRKGKPSFLYSLVQRTVQELSDVSRIQAKKFQEDASKSEESLNTLASQQVKLPLIVKNLKLEKNELQESFNNLEKELLESQSHSALLFGEEERLRSKSEALTKKIGELRSKNEELTHKLKTRKESDENPEKRKEISLKYRKEREVLVNKAIDSKSSQLENSVSYKDSAESSLVKSKTLHSRLTSLLIKIKELRASLRQPEDSERVDNTSEISVTRASGEVKKEGQISKKDSSKKTEVISPEPDKQFSWDHASNLRDNLEGLLKEYLKGSGHSLGRVLSAKRVLKKIEQLNNSRKSDDEKDRELLSFVRSQGIHTFGLNHKKSQLHAIYCTAELAFQHRVNESKREFQHQSKKSKDELDAMSKFIERKSKEKDALESSKKFLQSEVARVTDEKRKLGETCQSKEKEIDSLRKTIQEQTQVVERLRSANVELGMKYHSFHITQTTKGEAEFVQGQKAKMETLSAVDQKVEENRKKMNDADIQAKHLMKENAELEREVQEEFKSLAQDRGRPEQAQALPLDRIESRVKLWSEYQSAEPKEPSLGNAQEEHREELHKDDGNQLKPE